MPHLTRIEPAQVANGERAASSLAAMEKVPMSRFEAEEFVNDRYAAMDERIEVRAAAST